VNEGRGKREGGKKENGGKITCSEKTIRPFREKEKGT